MRSHQLEELSRRQFLKRAAIVAVALPVLPLGCAALKSSEATGQTSAAANQATAARNLAAAQDWAGAADGPTNPSWQTRMVSANEPGEPLLMTGTIFQPDGITPAKGVTLYVYHTDARGYYSNEPENTQPPPKPRLRGWMRTGDDGRYEFRTIKPGPYPGGGNPAHIHVTLSGEGYPEYWIDSYWFEDDPIITARHRAGLTGRGGFKPIVALKRDGQGVLNGIRDIRLEHL